MTIHQLMVLLHGVYLSNGCFWLDTQAVPVEFADCLIVIYFPEKDPHRPLDICSNLCMFLVFVQERPACLTVL